MTQIVFYLSSGDELTLKAAIRWTVRKVLNHADAKHFLEILRAIFKENKKCRQF